EQPVRRRAGVRGAVVLVAVLVPVDEREDVADLPARHVDDPDQLAGADAHRAPGAAGDLDAPRDRVALHASTQPPDRPARRWRNLHRTARTPGEAPGRFLAWFCHVSLRRSGRVRDRIRTA